MKKFYALLQIVFVAWAFYVMFVTPSKIRVFTLFFVGACVYVPVLAFFQLIVMWDATNEWKKITKKMHDISDAPNSHEKKDIYVLLGTIEQYRIEYEWAFELILLKMLIYPSIEIVRKSCENDLNRYLEAKERF